MKLLLEAQKDYPEIVLEPGETILEEGTSTGCLYILAEGAVEVHRGDVSISIADEPGAVFGEMSVLLDEPHTASVRAATKVRLYKLDDAKEFLAAHPNFLLPIAELLAKRLQSSTSYLVDIKKQFKDSKDHFGMVDTVLESLSHQQESAPFTPADELPSDRLRPASPVPPRAGEG